MGVAQLLPLLPYGLLFLLALAMPGWRSLLIFAVLAGGGLALLLIALYRESESAPGGAGFGIAVAIFVELMLLFGLLAGVLVRALLLACFKAKGMQWRKLLVAMLGFLLMPGLYSLVQARQSLLAAVPDDKCLTLIHRVEVAGVTYRLPSAPMFSVWVEEDEFYSFDHHQALRKFCSMNSRTGTAIRAITIRLDIETERLRRRGAVGEKFCREPRSPWAKALCSSDPQLRMNYPVRAAVYAPEGFEDVRLMPSRMGGHAYFLDAQRLAQTQSQVIDKQVSEIFDRYADGYWVARDRAWVNAAGEPFTLYCFTSADSRLYCRTTYRLPSGAHLQYEFYTTERDMEVTARSVDKHIRVLFDDLARP